MHRLLALAARNPQVLGIDENTALALVPGDRFTVMGEGAVVVFNGGGTHSNAPDVGNNETLAITDPRIHGLPRGYGFNLKTKRPIIPDRGEIDEMGGEKA